MATLYADLAAAQVAAEASSLVKYTGENTDYGYLVINGVNKAILDFPALGGGYGVNNPFKLSLRTLSASEMPYYDTGSSTAMLQSDAKLWGVTEAGESYGVSWYDDVLDAWVKVSEDIQVDQTYDPAGTGATSNVAVAEAVITRRFATVATLLADTGSHAEGDTLEVPSMGFAYTVAASGATDHHLTTAGGVKLYIQNVSDGIFVESVRATGASDVATFVLASQIANTLSVIGAGGGDAPQITVKVMLEPGRVYDLAASTATFIEAEHKMQWGCNGRATITGTSKGLVFALLRNAVFENINFVGFTTAVEFDTNNVDSNLIEFNNCWWKDCALGVDTVSYAASRSTVLVFNNCRAGTTNQIVKSYCDMTIFNDCHMRNADSAGAFIYADGQLIINGGIWTPYVGGATARWIDVDNTASAAWGSRSVSIKNARFGPESSGGIPVIYSWLSGNTAQGTRTTMTHISITDSYCGSSLVGTPQSTIVLMDNVAGTQTLAPNSISIRGGSLNASAGLVTTESGNPTAYLVGQFVINIDESAQAIYGSETTNSSTPIVESSLQKFVSHWAIANHTVDILDGPTFSIGRKRSVYISGNAASTLTDMTDALDGHQVTLIFRDSDVTVVDLANAGAFELSGSVNFLGTTGDTLTVLYDRAVSRWKEISRSVN